MSVFVDLILNSIKHKCTNRFTQSQFCCFATGVHKSREPAQSGE